MSFEQILLGVGAVALIAIGLYVMFNDSGDLPQ
jgi:hypothetical protein